MHYKEDWEISNNLYLLQARIKNTLLPDFEPVFCDK